MSITKYFVPDGRPVPGEELEELEKMENVIKNTRGDLLEQKTGLYLSELHSLANGKKNSSSIIQAYTKLLFDSQSKKNIDFIIIDKDGKYKQYAAKDIADKTIITVCTNDHCVTNELSQIGTLTMYNSSNASDKELETAIKKAWLVSIGSALQGTVVFGKAPKQKKENDSGLYAMMTMNALLFDNYNNWVIQIEKNKTEYVHIARRIIMAQLLTGKMDFTSTDIQAAIGKLKKNIKEGETNQDAEEWGLSPSDFTDDPSPSQSISVSPDDPSPSFPARSRSKKKSLDLLENNRCKCFLDPERSCGSYSRSKLRYDRTMLESVASKCGIPYKNVSIDTLCLAIKNQFYDNKKYNRLLEFFQNKPVPGIRPTYATIASDPAKRLSVKYIDLLLPVPERFLSILGYDARYTATLLTVRKAKGLLSDPVALARYKKTVNDIRNDSIQTFDKKIADKIGKRIDVSTYILAPGLNKGNIDKEYIHYLNKFREAVNRTGPSASSGPSGPSGSSDSGGPSGPSGPSLDSAAPTVGPKEPLGFRRSTITQENIDTAQNLLNQEDKDMKEEIVQQFNIEIKRKDIVRLRPEGWLNDEIINYYFKLIQQRADSSETKEGLLEILKEGKRMKILCFSSFFTVKFSNGYDYKGVKNWSKKAKKLAWSMDKILFPVHMHGNHWCLGVINVADRRFEYYDSLGGSNEALLNHMKKYMRDEAKHFYGENQEEKSAAWQVFLTKEDKTERKKEDINDDTFKEWKNFTPRPGEIPEQRNGYDCGVFTCINADFLSQGLPLDYTQADISNFRLKMVHDILNSKNFV